MQEKVIRIGDQDVKFRSSATIPRLYRIKFGRDIFRDFAKLEKSYQQQEKGNDGAPESSSLDIEDLELFENIAYIMAYHADHSIPGNIDDWLDQFEMFSIYEILPQIIDMWKTNLFTDAKSKKNIPAPSVR